MIKSTITALTLLFIVTVSEAQVANISDPRLTIELPDVNGNKIALSSLKGKVVLLDFWASWCLPCRAANKHLVKLYAKYKSKGFEIYSVSVDDEKSDWLNAIKKDGITWTQVNQPGSFDSDAMQRWRVDGLPQTFLIDKNGDVVDINTPDRKLAAKVASLLKK
jgi:thiol-disulfide isomerase/thioredoxin